MRLRVGWAAVIVACGLAGVSASAGAQAPPEGDWSVVDRQPPTTVLIFVLRGGEDVTGRLVRATAEDVTVATESGARAIPKSLVRKVTTADRQKDGLIDGGVRGGVIGAAAALGLVLAAFAACGEGCEGPSVGPVVAVAAATGFASGFGAGTLVDLAHDARLVLYRQPQGWW